MNSGFVRRVLSQELNSRQLPPGGRANNSGCEGKNRKNGREDGSSIDILLRKTNFGDKC